MVKIMTSEELRDEYRRRGNVEVKTIPSNKKMTCGYAGKTLYFRDEFDWEDTDTAQAMIDYYRKNGLDACCLHEAGKHQLYVEKKKLKKMI